MIYILDTADLQAIKHANEFYPIEGVTTNPSIIAKEKCDFKQRLLDIRNIIGKDKEALAKAHNARMKILDVMEFMRNQTNVITLPYFLFCTASTLLKVLLLNKPFYNFLPLLSQAFLLYFLTLL